MYDFHAEYEAHPDWVRLHARCVQEGTEEGTHPYWVCSCSRFVQNGYEQKNPPGGGFFCLWLSDFCCQMISIKKELNNNKKSYKFRGWARRPTVPTPALVSVGFGSGSGTFLSTWPDPGNEIHWKRHDKVEHPPCRIRMRLFDASGCCKTPHASKT